MNITQEQLDAQHLRNEQRKRVHDLVKVNLECAKAYDVVKLPREFNTKEWKERISFEWKGTLLRLQTMIVEGPYSIVVDSEMWVDKDTYKALVTGERCAKENE